MDVATLGLLTALLVAALVGAAGVLRRGQAPLFAIALLLLPLNLWAAWRIEDPVGTTMAGEAAAIGIMLAFGSFGLTLLVGLAGRVLGVCLWMRSDDRAGGTLPLDVNVSGNKIAGEEMSR